MSSEVEIYCGAPIEIRSEQAFLQRLQVDLEKGGEWALVLGNFCPDSKPLQIDFFVITQRVACLVELKTLGAPVRGGVNGPWFLVQGDGSQVPLSGKNPYRQALDAKYAMSDEMHKFARDAEDKAQLETGDKFFKSFDGVVCVYPELLPGSDPFRDRRVRVLGYDGLIELLQRGTQRPPWSSEQWRRFVMHMGLVRMDPGATEASADVREALTVVEGYVARFKQFNQQLPEWVPTSISQSGRDLVTIEDVEKLLHAGRHVQLIGPAGFGKSLAAHHLGLRLLGSQRIPVILRAREYDGNFSALLDRGVAHLHPDTGLRLMAAANTAGQTVTIIVDGYNECPERERAGLLRDLHALSLRWTCGVVITSQQQLELTGSLASETCVFGSPTVDERVAVMRSYLGDEPSRTTMELCEGFVSPYELSLAASCLGELEASPTRADLFDAFTCRSCGTDAKGIAMRVALTAIAEEMGALVRGTLPVGEAWRVVEAALAAGGIAAAHVPSVFGSSLLSVGQGRCAFVHELVEQFFTAEALRRGARNGHELALELARPRHRRAAEFVVGMVKDSAVARECLEALADPNAYREALDGKWGRAAQEAATQACAEVLRRADDALGQTKVEVADSMFLQVVAGPTWSSADQAAMRAIGEKLPSGRHVREVFSLARRTQEQFVAFVLGAEQDEARAKAARAAVFAGVFALQSPAERAPAVSTILHAVGWRPYAVSDVDVRKVLEHWLLRLDELSGAELFIIVKLLRGTSCAADVLPRLLRACWRVGPYHLRLDVLDLALGYASTVQGGLREEVVTFLNGLQPRDLGLSSMLVDTLNAYGLVEPPISQDAAASEIAAALSEPTSASHQGRAYGIVALIFEDVYQGAYYEAVEALPKGERNQLLCMAALGAPSYGFFVDWILAELLKCNEPAGVPAFMRWASEIPSDVLGVQQAVAQYIMAVEGCARFVSEPPALLSPKTDAGRAWEAYGHIRFWLARPGLADAERTASCRPLWQRLEGDLRFESVAPLCEMAKAEVVMARRGRDYLGMLRESWPSEVRGTLEFGLKHVERLPSIFRGGSPAETRACLIRQLGALGDPASIPILEGLVDDPELGSLAVEAIRSITAPEQTGPHLE